ncbi:MAG: desulfoferrodoxin family protein [Candidatus Cryptobacteroides sp.]
MGLKFFKCKHCGNVVVKLVDSTVPLVCCGEKMEELKANTVEASIEKHLPVLDFPDSCTVEVRVGSNPHPMLPEHHIAFICLETEDGVQIADLKDKPEAKAVFLTKAKVKAAYEYCNLHGLWKTVAD